MIGYDETRLKASILGGDASEFDAMDEIRKDAEYSLGKSFGVAFKQAVPFGRQLMEQNTYSLDFDKEDINWMSEDIMKITDSVPSSYREELFESRNKSHLLAKVAGIKSGTSDAQYMNEQHGLAASMALYAAASVFDPISWTGYGLVAKGAGALKFMEAASTARKAAYWGASGAIIEGGSEAIIQSGGERQYESVPLSAGIGLVFAGGGSLASSLLTNVTAKNQTKALDELTEALPTAETKEGREKIVELLETVQSESAIQPIRSKISSIIDKATGQNIPALRSPTYQAYIHGGDLSEFARLIDTPAGISMNPDGSIVRHVDETVMDVKYDIGKHFLDMEVARVKAHKESGMTRDTFTKEVWNKSQELRQEYESRIRNLEAELDVDVGFSKEARDTVRKKIENENVDGTIEYKDKIIKERDDLIKELKKSGNKKEAKLMEELQVKAKEEYRTKLEDDLYKKELRKEAIARSEDMEINTGNKGIDDMIKASSGYYETIHKMMKDAGIEEAETMLNKFYTPIVYDIKNIKMHDAADVEKAFETAIRESKAYKEELAKLQEEIRVLATGGNKELNLDKAKVAEIKALENKMNKLEDVISNRHYLSTSLSDIMADIDRLHLSDIINDKALEDSIYSKNINGIVVPRAETLEKMKTIISSNKDIQELMKLSGVTEDSILKNGFGAHYSSISNKLALGTDFDAFMQSADGIKLQEKILRHELIHAISSREINANSKLRKELRDISDDIINRYDELIKTIEEEVDITVKEADGLSIKDRVDYMLGKRDTGELAGSPHELLAVGLSNPYIARALNKMKASTTRNGDVLSLFKKLYSLLKNSLGIKRLNKNSIFYSLLDTMEANIKKNPMDDKIRKSMKEANEISNKLDKYYISMSEGRLNKAGIKEKKRLEAKLDKLLEPIVNNKKYFKEKLDAHKKSVDARKAELHNTLSDKTKELQDLKAYPTKAAKGTVKNIQETKKVTDINFDDFVPSFAKGRKLPIDVTHPSLENYVVKNEAALAQMYNYTMGGRVATKKITGFDKSEDMRRFLVDTKGFSGKKLKIAMEMYELALGSKQIPSNPDAGWEQAARNISHFNYITMGGQFGITALSEIGAGVYRTGFRYIPELFPALKNVIGQYKGRDLTVIEESTRHIVDAASIMERQSNGAFADTDWIESTFATGLERGLKKASNAMFKWSGLEGITTMTQVAIPRMFLERIIKEADRPTAKLDMLRWGIDLDDMKAIKNQPVIRDSRGDISDFNFEKWDKDLATKFQRVAMRMSRDTIMRPDAVRVPTWLNDGNMHPLIKLTKQFMTFTFLSNERLMLAGMNENQAMALTGTVISAAILYAAKTGSEEVGVALGLMDDDDRRYTGSDENIERLAKYVATRNSFAGGIGMVAETLAAAQSPYGTKELTTKFAGGPTGSRAWTGVEAMSDLLEGKKGTYSQVATFKSMIPYNNIIGFDQFNKSVARDIIESSKENKYYAE